MLILTSRGADRLFPHRTNGPYDDVIEMSDNELFFYSHVLSSVLRGHHILFYGTVSSSVVNCCFFSKYTI